MASLSDVLARLRRALVPEIVGQLADAAPDGPVYCLAVAYNAEEPDRALPPFIGVGLDAERRAWRDERGDGAWELAWNPAEFEHFDHLALEDGPGLAALYREAEGLLAAEPDAGEALRDWCCELARELGTHPGLGGLRRTPDFVAYAVDLETADLDVTMPRCATPDQLATLRAGGWLPRG